MKKFFLSAAVSAVVLAPLGASAVSFKKPEDAIKYRQSTFAVMATHFGDLGAMVKGDKPFDAKAAQANADIVMTLSTLPWAGFGPGTEGGKAEPAIWKENAKFKSAADKMQAAVAELNSAAQSGNPENLKKALGATSQTCKACHDDFRKK